MGATCFVIERETTKSGTFQNGTAAGIFVPKRQEGTGGWRKL
jgi:hypothetical protein